MASRALRPGARFTLLDSVRDRLRPVRLRCGKCGHVLDVVVGDPSTGHVVGKQEHLRPVPPPEWPDDLPSSWKVQLSQTPAPPPTPRPRVIKERALDPNGLALMQRHTYTCGRKRCTGRWPVTMDSLVVAYVKAVRASAADIHLPVGSD